MSTDRCPSCGTPGMAVFHEAPAVPTNSCILMETREEALTYPRGAIRLGFCHSCGFISNLAFEPALTEYSGRYEETQGFSPTFNAFHRALAERLIERYDLHGKDIVEIGCGKGEFLMLLCELGGNRGVGFDPGVRHERIQGPAAESVRFVPDFYSEAHAEVQGDFFACKMTLEHIAPTGDFVRTVRNAIGERAGTLVFFQIPETTRILESCAFEDIYYEHCSYFTPGSLARLFRRSGFEVLGLSTEYQGQYLTIEARAAPEPVDQTPLPEEQDLGRVRDLVGSFPGRFAAKRTQWEARIREAAAKGRRIVLWGSGSKAVSFLTTLELGDAIQYAVDINPYRQGHFLPGTGQEILAPEALTTYRPDLVVIMNAVYREEIARDLERLGLAPELVAL
ncbi:MAG: class I SAM-dependent methyltransferase [Chromatiaceae bacterium]